MNSISIEFENPYLLFILIPAFAAVFLPYILQPAHKRTGVRKIVPLIVHLILAALLTLAVSGLTFVISNDHSSIIILADFSESMEGHEDEVYEYIDDIIKGADEKTQIGIVSFAGDTEYSYALGRKFEGQITTNVKANATNLATAIDEATALFPESTINRLVIVSDGKITEGDAVASAAAAEELGIRVDSFYVSSDLLFGETQLTSFTAASAVKSGLPFSSVITVDTNVAGSAELSVRDNGVAIYSEYVELTSGKNVFRNELTVETSGEHSLTASITPVKDTKHENNSMTISVNADLINKILIVTNTNGEANLMMGALQNVATVKRVDEKSAPTTITAMLEYDEIILINVSVLDLPTDFDVNIKKYVEEYGKTLLTIGGRETYFIGGMTNSAFNELLPINIDADAGEGQIALIIIIDCSGSMNQNNRIQMAKDGAKTSLNILSAGDYLGIISFSNNTTVRVPIAPLVSRPQIETLIDGLRTENGTRIYTALQEAKDQFSRYETSAAKHVLLLSDGAPTDNHSQKEYNDIVTEMKEIGVTTSTIAIEPSTAQGGSRYGITDYAGLMRGMAEAGGGTYYECTNSSELSGIMLAATASAKVEYRNDVEFTPTVARDDAELVNVNEVPKLGGYIYSTAKGQATNVLITEKEAEKVPIYSYWKYGKGMVCSFMSDLNYNFWAKEWQNNDSATALMQNMALARISPTSTTSGMNINISAGGYAAYIDVNTVEVVQDMSITALVETPGEEPIQVLLSGSGLTYSGNFPLDHSKEYDITITQMKGRTLMDEHILHYRPNYSQEYNYFSADGLTNLTSVSDAGGGEIMLSISDFFEVYIPITTYYYDPSGPILIAGIVLLLADFAMRMLRIKDIKAFFGIK